MDLRASEERKRALRELSAFVSLTNETVGDALCDLLLVESVLRHCDWSISHWDALYQDLPQRQLKVAVSTFISIS